MPSRAGGDALAARDGQGARSMTTRELAEAIAALPGMEPVERSRSAVALIDVAKAVLSTERGAALAELTAPGGPYHRRIPALAAELGVSRGKIDDALAAHRATSAGQRPRESKMSETVTYAEVPAAEVPAGIVWVVPRRNMGQAVETAYSDGRPGGRGFNYDADHGDPWMRVTDTSEPAGSQVTYYKRG